MRLLHRWALPLVLPAALVTLWWYTAKDSTSLFYPALGEVIDALKEQWLFEQVGSDLVPSLIRLGLGYTLAAVLGIGGGLLLGLNPWLQRASQPVVEFVRAIPPPLLIPFVVVVLSNSGTTSKVVIIALGSVWPVLLNTITGVRSVDRQMLDMATSYGVPRRQRLWRIILPGASPHIMVGLRTALAIAIILMVISEMRNTREGVGYRVLEAQRGFDSAGTIAGIVVIGVVGVVLNVAFVAVEGRIMRWYRGSRGLLAAGRAREHHGTAADRRQARHDVRRRRREPVHGDRRGVAGGRARRVRVHRRPVRLRQDHDAARPVRPDGADEGRGAPARQAGDQAAAAMAARVPGLQPLAAAVARPCSTTSRCR